MHEHHSEANDTGMVQDPGSLDPLASALARVSGSSQRALDQLTRRGSNTSIVSVAGSTSSSLMPTPGGPHSQPHSLMTQQGGSPAASLAARGSYETPSRSQSGPLTSAAQMSHPVGGSERGGMQYAGAAAQALAAAAAAHGMVRRYNCKRSRLHWRPDHPAWLFKQMLPLS